MKTLAEYKKEIAIKNKARLKTAKSSKGLDFDSLIKANKKAKTVDDLRGINATLLKLLSNGGE